MKDQTSIDLWLDSLVDKGIIRIPLMTSSSFCELLDHCVEAQMLAQRYKHIGGAIAGHLNFSFHGIDFSEINELVYSVLIPIAKKYLNSSSCRAVIGCNVNLPGSINQHWHSDSDYNDNWLVVNVPIVDFTKSNGATDVIPASHRKPISYLEFLLAILKWHLSVHSLQGCQAGDLIIRDSNLWHRATRNISNRQRSMLSISLFRSESDEIQYQSDSTGFYPNWFSSTTWRFHERFYVYFPFLYSLLRIYRSLRVERGMSS
jgi:hypothetical protein